MLTQLVGQKLSGNKSCSVQQVAATIYATIDDHDGRTHVVLGGYRSTWGKSLVDYMLYPLLKFSSTGWSKTAQIILLRQW